MTKLYEFLASDEEADVLNSYTDDMFPCLCGPVVLTDKGIKEFQSILSKPVFLDDDCLTVEIENGKELKALRRLCYAAAGYISEKEYGELFEQ